MRVATYRKYGNQPLTIDGYRFDSQAEARRYAELRILQRIGEIEDLRVHPTYELLAPFIDLHGKRHKGITYEADFAYQEVATGMPVVEDVKGVETAQFKLKAKMLMARYGYLDLRVVQA